MAGIRLADTLEFFWVLRGRGRENLPRVTALVDRAAPGTAARARALLVAAHVRGVMLGDNEGGLQLVDEAEGICRALGDLHGTAMALMRRGQIVAFGVGDNPRATALFTEARATFRQLGGEIGPENPITSFLGQVARSEGDYDRALALLDESLTVSRERRDGHAVAYALREVAIVRHLQGDDEQAIALFRESIAALGPLKDIRCAHDCFLRLADVLSARGIPVNVARLFGAAREMRERIGRPLTPGLLAAHERALAAVERRLDPEAFAAAWAEGRAMSLDEAIAYALTEAVVI